MGEFNFAQFTAESGEQQKPETVADVVRPYSDALSTFHASSERWNDSSVFQTVEDRGKEGVQWRTYEERDKQGKLQKTSRLLVPKKRGIIASRLSGGDLRRDYQLQVEPEGARDSEYNKIQLALSESLKNDDVTMQIVLHPDFSNLAALFPDHHIQDLIQLAKQLSLGKEAPITTLQLALSKGRKGQQECKLGLQVTENPTLFKTKTSQHEDNLARATDAFNRADASVKEIEALVEKLRNDGIIDSNPNMREVLFQLSNARSARASIEDEMVDTQLRLGRLHESTVTYSLDGTDMQVDRRTFQGHAPTIKTRDLPDIARGMLRILPVAADDTSDNEFSRTSIVRILTPGERVKAA